jgi:hypothetical protein
MRSGAEPDVDRLISQHGYEAGPTYGVHGASAFHGKHEPKLREALDDMGVGRISVLVVGKATGPTVRSQRCGS